MDFIQANVVCLSVRKSDTIKLKDHGVVLGISVEIPSTSVNDGNIQYNEGSNLALFAGGPARAFGGFYGTVPVSYNGEVKINFDADNALNEAIVILTVLKC